MQTKAGAKIAAQTNKRKYGDNYYAVIGQLGGSAGHTGGFHVNRELAKVAGAKGGRAKWTEEQRQAFLKRKQQETRPKSFFTLIRERILSR